MERTRNMIFMRPRVVTAGESQILQVLEDI